MFEDKLKEKFGTEIDENRYYFEKVLKEQKGMLKNIPDKRLKHLASKKIKQLEDIIEGIFFIMYKVVDLEEYLDFKNTNEENELNKKIIELEHVVANYIQTVHNPEIKFLRELYEKSKEVIEREEYEIKLLEYFERLMAKIDIILKKHKTKNEEEEKIILELRKRVVKIYINFRKIVRECKKQIRAVLKIAA